MTQHSENILTGFLVVIGLIAVTVASTSSTTVPMQETVLSACTGTLEQEPNNDPSTVQTVGNVDATGLTLCGAITATAGTQVDRDAFRVTATSSSFALSLAWDQTADYDLEVWTLNGTLVGSSAQIDPGREQLVVTGLNAGTEYDVVITPVVNPVAGSPGPYSLKMAAGTTVP